MNKLILFALDKGTCCSRWNQTAHTETMETAKAGLCIRPASSIRNYSEGPFALLRYCCLSASVGFNKNYETIHFWTENDRGNGRNGSPPLAPPFSGADGAV